MPDLIIEISRGLHLPNIFANLISVPSSSVNKKNILKSVEAIHSSELRMFTVTTKVSLQLNKNPLTSNLNDCL